MTSTRRHDPFVYFHSIIDNQAACDAHVVGLSNLDGDLGSAATTPNYSFITEPLQRRSRRELPKRGPGGLPAVDAFLRAVVPALRASAAYRQGGLIAIVFDEAVGDSTACCGEPPGPNTLTPGGNGPGGGATGAVLLSPFMGHGVGDSLCDAEGVAIARRLLEDTGGRLRLPVDLVVADRFAVDAQSRVVVADGIEAGWMGMDIGPHTRAAYADVIERAGTAFWNGPVGAYELEPFAAGTRATAEAMGRSDATTVVGGGDLVGALQRFGLADRVTHICTSGGASLEFIEGRMLPAYAALVD